MNNNLYMSSLLKAFDVLDCFQDDKQELGISDIAVLVGMPVSSVHRLIQSLEYEGMLIQNRETKKYSLGSTLMAIVDAKKEQFAQQMIFWLGEEGLSGWQVHTLEIDNVGTVVESE